MAQQNFEQLFGTALGIASPFAKMGFDFIKNNADYAYNKEMALRGEARQRDAERNAMAQNMHQSAIQNAYNSPSAQMARLRDAGLNPMLAFSNGVGGNLSTGVPSAVTPSAMQSPTYQSSDADLLSGFLTLADQFNKKRELDIMSSRATFDNAKTDAETKGILKQNIFMDAIEHDRHAQHEQDQLLKQAQTALYWQQKQKCIDDVIAEKNRLFEQKRQFKAQLSYYRERDASQAEIARLDRESRELIAEKERALKLEMEELTNSTWERTTMQNSDYYKFGYFMDHYESPWKRIAQYEGIKLGQRSLGQFAEGMIDGVGGSFGKSVVRRTRNMKERVSKWIKKEGKNPKAQELQKRFDNMAEHCDKAVERGDFEEAQHWADQQDKIWQEMQNLAK